MIEFLPAVADADSAAYPVALVADIEAAKEYAAKSQSAATRAAYAKDWTRFVTWCAANGAEALPARPAAVAVFLAAEAKRGCKPATVTRAAAAIAYRHTDARLPSPGKDPAVAAVLAGIRREHGTAKRRAAPATSDLVMAMAVRCGADLRGLRDRALLLIGFGGAFRRSELVSLRLEDIEETADGLRVRVARSKTDQEGAGQVVPVLDGPRLRVKAALAEWIQAAGITSGYLFRSIYKNESVQERAITPASVALIIKSRAKAAGFDPSTFSGHSLRAGFITSAAANRADLFKIKDVSRHKSLDVLQGYVRDSELFTDHAGRGFM